MAYINFDFPAMDPGESEPVAFDFGTMPYAGGSPGTGVLAEGETIVSTSVGVASFGGLDAYAASHAGSATTSGSTVTFQMSGLQGGIKYLVEVQATTSLGNVKSLYSHITCNSPT